MITATGRGPRAALLLALWAVAVVAATMFPIRPHQISWAGSAWWAVIVWVPFAVPPLGFAANVAMFVPLGVLLPLLWPRTGSVARMAAWGLGVSAAIELTQLALWVTIGNVRTVDVNDLMANTAGAVLGLLALRLALFGLARRRYDDFQARM